MREPQGIPSGTKEAAEKGIRSSENLEEHTSGAKARADSIGFFAGDKSPAYRTIEFFRSL